ncbi:MAG TPA: peptide MFS transporter [Rhizomicrobium sp.]|nr:peptide MFS transporter [Rhizomicrobium sp.]
MTAAADAPPPSRSNTAFFGHPSGLGWLAFTELWERFSYYGMAALLVLYMTHALLQPGHIENIAGFGAFRWFVSLFYGNADSPQALSSNIYGVYTAFVYLTPLGGGFLADRYLGRTTSVTIGALLMAMGHFLMAFDVSFVFALVCLMFGVGFFKGNIASQVGDLYGPEDPRRADAFQIFLLFVQFSVIASPFVCGSLGEWYGWHWGFGAAGVGMLIGLATYLFGRYSLPPEPPRKTRNTAAPVRPPLSRNDWIKMGVLIVLLPVLAVSLVGNQDIFNAYLVWSEQNYQLVFFGKTMPITWLLSFDAVFSALTIGAAVAFWRWWATKWTEPDEITKITIGVCIAALAPLMLAAASVVVATTHQKVGLVWAVGFHLINDLGFANVFPVGLALYSRAAPKGLTGLVIGLFYLHLFGANLFVGWVGALLEKMSAPSFWLLHVGLMLGAAAILMVVRFSFGKILAPAYSEADMAVERTAA